jgi:hypothetical protein
MKRRGFFELFRDEATGAPKKKTPSSGRTEMKKREPVKDRRILDPTMADLEPHRYRRR